MQVNMFESPFIFRRPVHCTVSPMYMRSEGQVFALRNTHTLYIIQAAESEGKVGKVK